jgi:hypothetical protein
MPLVKTKGNNYDWITNAHSHIGRDGISIKVELRKENSEYIRRMITPKTRQLVNDSPNYSASELLGSYETKLKTLYGFTRRYFKKRIFYVFGS